MEDTESLLSDENESGDHDEPNDVNLCHNMPWIKVVNATASFLHRLVLSEFVMSFRIRFKNILKLKFCV